MDTSIFSHLNWLAILVAAIAYFIIGGLWYSKLLFGNLWIKKSGVDMNDPNAKKGVGAVMFFTMALEFITCIGLAFLVTRLGLVGGFMSGIKLGLFTGVFFSAIAIGISYMYQRKSTALCMVDSGYHIVGQVVAAIILCMWV